MLRYTSGSVLHGSNIREALEAASAILVAEGYPAITVVSGDREYDEQVAIFLDRYVPVGEVNGRRVYDFRWWEGRQWARISPAGTVAAPSRTAPHVARIAADLGWPYNDSGTAAHRRLQQIAPGLGLDWTGRFFGEDWHWETTRGVGRIDDSRPAGNQSEEDDMYDDAAKDLAEKRHSDIILALEKIHRAAAPFKVISWGTGLVVYNPENGKIWVLPEGYYDLLYMLGLVGGNPVTASTEQLGFATGFVPAALGEQGGDGDGFTSADLDEIKKAISQSQLVVTPDQLKKLTDAVGAAARTGGEQGAVKALKDLTFVVTAS